MPRGPAGAEEKEWQMFSMAGCLKRILAEIYKQEISTLGFVFLNKTKTSNYECFLIT